MLLIPLLYILPTDEVYTDSSGIIKSITPVFSHARHAIQIEFEYNLDEFFYLEIVLSEFDQPREMSLYGYYGSSKLKVTDDVDTYLLKGKKVAVSITKAVILDIANNAVSEASFLLGTEITLRVIKPQADVASRPKVTKLSAEDSTIVIGLYGEEMVYRQGGKKYDYLPILTCLGTTTVPTYIDGHYNIFDLDGVYAGLSLVITPPHDFNSHYLFRQEPMLSACTISENDDFLLGGYIPYSFTNGIIETHGRTVSSQEFLIYGPTEDYKTYIFNATRDKNLYSEITLLFPAVQHHSMTIYDLEDNILIKGVSSQDVIIDSGTDRVMHRLKLTDCRDFFGRDVNKEFEFIYYPAAITDSSWEDRVSAYGAGNFYVTDIDVGDRDISPIDNKHIDIQKEGYISGSNNKYMFSVKKEKLKKLTQSTDYTVGKFKRITSNDYISPRYSFKFIDFVENIIGIKNGSTLKKIPILTMMPSVISRDESIISETKKLDNFAGISIVFPVHEVSTEGINITNFNDYLLLCRSVESVEYGVYGVKKGTENLRQSLIFTFDYTEIGMVYNFEKDKVYYINFSQKDVSDDVSNLPYSISKYIGNIDEEELKLFLRNGSMGTYDPSPSPNSSFITTENGDLFYEDSTRETFLEADGNISFMLSGGFGLMDSMDVLNESAGIGVYVSRKSAQKVLRGSFGSDTTVFRKFFSGIYCNKDIYIDFASVTDGVFSMLYTHDETQYSVEIVDDGGSLEYMCGLKTNIVDGTDIYDTIIPLTISGSIRYDKIFQTSHIIVADSDFGASMAFDITAIRYMMGRGVLGINETIYSTLGDGGALLRPDVPVSSITATSTALSFGAQSIEIGSSTGSAVAIIEPVSGGEIVATVSSIEYANLLDDRDEPTDENYSIEIGEYSNEHCYAILLPIENTQHIQLKERQ